ncbi:hypothetical protein B566_EDAN012917 [Ephemera danica]|nr:hypothetical protein B566_EDAN012917 [Ephemera danica]
MKHGNFEWTIKRRFKHFYHLHQQLRLFRASLNIPFPTKQHRDRRASFKADTRPKIRGRLRVRPVPRLPSTPDAQIRPEQMEQRKEELQNYLESVLHIKVFRNHTETLNFLEVSPLSFVDQVGGKGKEGQVKKRTGSAQQGGWDIFGIFNNPCVQSCSKFCSQRFGRWGRRWLFVKDSCVGYIQVKTGVINNVMLMDRRFEVTQGRNPHFLKISNMSRSIVVDCMTERKCSEWIEFLKNIAVTSGLDFTRTNRYLSFVPVREHTEAAWFVDGAGFMAAAANAIEMAKEEILIADWWLSPEIYLKRPANTAHTYRLDKMLERKATQGVRVFVMLFQEVKQALNLNSKYSKNALMKWHENIKVLRHPTHAKSGVLLWAHHEKILAIDQTYAFVGGIDLCYGRWDDHKHRLTDLGRGSTSVDSGQHPPLLPHKAKTSSRPRGNTMGSSVITLARSTNHLLRSMLDLQSTSTLDSEKPKTETLEKAAEQTEVRRSLTTRMREMRKKFRSIRTFYKGGTGEDGEAQTGPDVKSDSSDNSSDEEYGDNECIDDADIGMAKLWVGKDYMNCIVKDLVELDAPFSDLIDRETTPRLPWHDIHVMVQGSAARDVARHFIQRWNAIKLEKAKKNNEYPYLLPKAYDPSMKIPPLFPKPLPKVKCQVVRSVSQWSANFLSPASVEQSIHEAYIEAIRDARHYIYIENQFFITQVTPLEGKVENRINQALFQRILAAHNAGETFRVYVVMPLLPAFEGEMGTSTGGALASITHWNYASINRGKGAILERLKDEGIENPSDYISFYGLRAHAMLNGELVSELIYVHSKLLIADDRRVICGSANINDRSLLGTRDSEIAVVLEDEEFSDSVMNGKHFQSGRYAGPFRRRIFREHLGLLEDADGEAIVRDPVCSEFYHDRWQATADRNTKIFEEVFHCIPSDYATSFVQLKKYLDEPPLSMRDLDAAKQALTDVQGFLVNLPLKFLASENLSKATNVVEGLLPNVLWV